MATTQQQQQQQQQHTVTVYDEHAYQPNTSYSVGRPYSLGGNHDVGNLREYPSRRVIKTCALYNWSSVLCNNKTGN